MNCPYCNYTTGTLAGVPATGGSLGLYDPGDGDIYVCPDCGDASFFHDGKLCEPSEQEKVFLQDSADAIERVKSLYKERKREMN